MAPAIRRLGSLNKSKLGAKPKPAAPPPTITSSYNCCNEPKVEDDGEGHKVCMNCYTQISESNIVAEITFQEDSRGAATVQGGTINENARYARTLGSASKHLVGGGNNSQQEREANGRRTLASWCPKLGVPETTSNQALALYSLASNSKFSAGRRTEEVIAACLYAVCRRQKDNTVLLIDISELIHINVFRLGEVYKDLCDKLYLPDDKIKAVGTQHLVEVESLIMKYCRKLEFGEMTRQVAEDATRIVRRMKRDWMVTGRHPAGLCGASIILAARMNNFRRTVRETVYVAKVADITIAKRVEEFRRLKSSTLTVDQFREFGNRIKHQADPPILYESELRKEKWEDKKRKRQEASQARDTVEISDDGFEGSSRETSAVNGTPVQEQNGDENGRRKRRRTSRSQLETPGLTQGEPRRDADGFVIPPRPIDAGLNGDDGSDERKRPGRRKKLPPEPVIITEEELMAEEELEKEIDDVLNDEQIEDSRTELEKAKSEQRAKDIANQEKQSEADKAKSRRESAGITWWTDEDAGLREIATAEELEAEFADDPEVSNCLLPEAEQKVKEMIWVKHNEDWMRAQQEKQLIAAVAKAAGRDEKGKKGTKGVKRKRKGKMGDGITLAEAGRPIETPADATAAMLEARAPKHYTSAIDYAKLAQIYRRTPSTTTSDSRTGSQAPDTMGGASRDATPSVADREASEARESASPSRSPSATPSASRLQTPAATQQVAGAPSSSTTSRHRPADPQAPPSPQQTQAQAGAEDEESEGDPDDYLPEEALDYGSDVGSPTAWDGDEDDREDIGEEDYRRAVHPENQLDAYYGEEDFV